MDVHRAVELHAVELRACTKNKRTKGLLLLLDTTHFSETNSYQAQAGYIKLARKNLYVPPTVSLAAVLVAFRNNHEGCILAY